MAVLNCSISSGSSDVNETIGRRPSKQPSVAINPTAYAVAAVQPQSRSPFMSAMKSQREQIVCALPWLFRATTRRTFVRHSRLQRKPHPYRGPLVLAGALEL